MSAEPPGLAREQVEIKLEWSGITVEIETAKGPKKILDSIAGEAVPGEMLAIMGPSGAGKTSLLNCLAMRNNEFQGALLANGRDYRADASVQTSVAYMHQAEVFLKELTVREHLDFQAELRTPLPRPRREAQVTDVLMQLGLDKVQGQLIGDPNGEQGHFISRNERKRLNFATEILTNPSLLMVDEPTTGLDSFMAESVVQHLRGLTRGATKRTVVATIHQPSSEVFRLFDKLMFLVDGRVAYFGPASAAVAFFTKLGHPPPSHCNPADHVMRLFVNPGDPTGSAERRVQVCDAYAKEHAQSTPAAAAPEAAAADARKFGYDKGFPAQVALLWRREFRMRLRSKEGFKIRLAQNTVFGVWFALTYWQTEVNQTTVLTVSAALFMMVMIQFFTSVMVTPQLLPGQIQAFLRESRNGSYSLPALYVAKQLVDAPLNLLFTGYWTFLTFWTLGLRRDAEGEDSPHFLSFVSFWLVLFFVVETAMGFGYVGSFGAPPTQPEVAFLISIAIMMPQMIFGGFFISMDTVPESLHFLRDLSVMRYGFSLLSIFMWEDYGPVPCGPPTPSAPNGFCPYDQPGSPPGSATGQFLLDQVIAQDTSLEQCILALVLLMGFFRLAAFGCLRRRARPSLFESAAPDAGTETLDQQPETSENEVHRTREQLTIEWSKLTFAPLGPKVLDGVGGRAAPGELLVVMGPSGCGKTTLMQALASRNRDIGGTVTYNGQLWSNSLQTQVGYMHQEDLFLAELTVEEHLRFTASLKMHGASAVQREQRVQSAIQELGLEGCKDTMIGTIGAGISGGERKRLSLAAEILSDPALLIVDEPTSGLDSAMAESVIQLLQRLCKGSPNVPPRTIIATVHQPSNALFDRFDTLSLLTGGAQVYFGPAKDAVAHFDRLGFPCPADANPPEHFMRLVSQHLGADQELRQRAEARITQIRRATAELGAGAAPATAAAPARGQVYDTSLWNQLKVLRHRETVLRRRSKLLFKAVIGRTIFITLIVGAVWWQIEATGTLQTVQSVMGLLQFVVMNQFFTSGAGLAQTLPLMMPSVLREHYNGLYSIPSWYCAKVIADLPFEVLFPCILGSCVFWLTGLNALGTEEKSFEVWFWFVACLVTSAQVGNAWGYASAAIGRTLAGAFGVFASFTFPWLFYAGLMINLDEIPDYFIWLKETSAFRFIYQAVSIKLWQYNEGLACPSDGQCPFKSGKIVLQAFALKPDDFAVSWAYTGLILLLMRLGAIFFFMQQAKRKALTAPPAGSGQASQGSQEVQGGHVDTVVPDEKCVTEV